MFNLHALLSAASDIISSPSDSSTANNPLSVESITSVDSVNDGGKLSPFSQLVDEYGGGAYNVLFKLIIWIIVIAFLIAAGKLAFSSSENRKFIKNDIVARVLAAILACSVIGGVAYLQSVGANLFDLVG